MNQYVRGGYDPKLSAAAMQELEAQIQANIKHKPPLDAFQDACDNIRFTIMNDQRFQDAVMHRNIQAAASGAVLAFTTSFDLMAGLVNTYPKQLPMMLGDKYFKPAQDSGVNSAQSLYNGQQQFSPPSMEGPQVDASPDLSLLQNMPEIQSFAANMTQGLTSAAPKLPNSAGMMRSMTELPNPFQGGHLPQMLGPSVNQGSDIGSGGQSIPPMSRPPQARATNVPPSSFQLGPSQFQGASNSPILPINLQDERLSMFGPDAVGDELLQNHAKYQATGLQCRPGRRASTSNMQDHMPPNSFQNNYQDLMFMRGPHDMGVGYKSGMPFKPGMMNQFSDRPDNPFRNHDLSQVNKRKHVSMNHITDEAPFQASAAPSNLQPPQQQHNDAQKQIKINQASQRNSANNINSLVTSQNGGSPPRDASGQRRFRSPGGPQQSDQAVVSETPNQNYPVPQHTPQNKAMSQWSAQPPSASSHQTKNNTSILLESPKSTNKVLNQWVKYEQDKYEYPAGDLANESQRMQWSQDMSLPDLKDMFESLNRSYDQTIDGMPGDDLLLDSITRGSDKIVSAMAENRQDGLQQDGPKQPQQP